MPTLNPLRALAGRGLSSPQVSSKSRGAPVAQQGSEEPQEPQRLDVPWCLWDKAAGTALVRQDRRT